MLVRLRPRKTLSPDKPRMVTLGGIKGTRGVSSFEQGLPLPWVMRERREAEKGRVNKQSVQL